MSQACLLIQEALIESRNIAAQREQYVFSKLAFTLLAYIENKHEKIIWTIKNNTKYGVKDEVEFQLEETLSQVEGDTLTRIKTHLEQYILDSTGIAFTIKIENDKHVFLVLKV